MNKVRYGSKDIFNLGANFLAQNSTETEAITYAEKKDVHGEQQCVKAQDHTLTVQGTYSYKGADLINELKNLITLGDLKEDFLVTAISITFSNTATVQISITGHKHLSGNGHNDGSSVLSVYEVDLSLLVTTIPNCMGVPVDGPFANSNPDAALRSMNINFSCTHNDINSNMGVHKCGHNFAGRVAVNLSFIGIPDVTLPEGWQLTSKPIRSSNQSFELTEISAYRSLDRIAV
jgi:hypothetical protein